MWSETPFPETLATAVGARRGKLLARDYKTTGRFPVVDQGQNPIAGWTDDESLVISEGLPYVVFGDHTRAFKFVDFPFVLGADGTQLLKPKSDFNPLFFYFACKTLDIPSRGYNRHFGLLKERGIPRPPKPDQERIAAVLWKVQKAVDVQDKLVRTTRELKAAAMRQLFTHGLRNEPLKETEIGLVPASWNVGPLSDLTETVDAVDLASESERTIEYIDVSSVSRESLRIVSTRSYKLKDAPGRARKRVLQGDTIFATIRPTLRRIARVGPELDNQVCSTAFCVLRDKTPLTGAFIFYLVQRPEFVGQLARLEKGASYPAVTDKQLKAQLVPIPTTELEQREIAEMLAVIDRKIAVHEKKRATLLELFEALLPQLMTARFRVHDLDIDTSEVAG